MPAQIVTAGSSIVVSPVLECVTNNDDGTFTASFGYNNEGTLVREIPVGANNRFSGTPSQDAGQPGTFQPGRVRNVFEVTANNETNVVWSLNSGTNRTATGSAGNPTKCVVEPVIPVECQAAVNGQGPFGRATVQFVADGPVGGSGSQVIIGTPGNDVIDGGSGNDLICGGGGDDIIYGGSGNDVIYGGSGNDQIFGGSGADTIDGGPGTDTCDGGTGSNAISNCEA